MTIFQENKMIGRIIIKRYHQNNNQTTGVCTILDESGFPLFSSISLERGWRDNERRVSCIPQGMYEMEYEYSNRFKKSLWEIKNVPGRSECKFHSANYWYELNGCISLGVSPTDLNNDGYRDVTSSKKTIKTFERILNKFDKVVLIIEDHEI